MTSATGQTLAAALAELGMIVQAVSLTLGDLLEIEGVVPFRAKDIDVLIDRVRQPGVQAINVDARDRTGRLIIRRPPSESAAWLQLPDEADITLVVHDPDTSDVRGQIPLGRHRITISSWEGRSAIVDLEANEQQSFDA